MNYLSLLTLFSLLLTAFSASYTNYIHPTQDPLIYYVVFSRSIETTIASSASLVTQLPITFACDSGTITASGSIAFYDSSFKIAKITVTATEIPIASTLTAAFTSAYASFFSSPSMTIDMIAYSSTSSGESNIKALGNANYYSGLAWFGIAVADMFMFPHSLTYMTSKLTLEIVDMFKMAKLYYSDDFNYYNLENNNRISGFKTPNWIQIILEGDEMNSGYDRIDSDFMTGSGRDDNLELVSVERVQQFNLSTLFLDNFGTQICVLVGILMVIGILELVGSCLRRRGDETKTFTRIQNFFKWNFFIANLVASSASGIFYSAVQISSFYYSTRTGTNLWNFIVVILYYLVILMALFWMIRNVKEIFITSIEDWCARFSILHAGYKMDRLLYPANTIALVIKGIVFAILLVLPITGMYQVAALLAISVTYITLLVIYRPFSHKFTFIVQLTLEGIQLMVLICMFILGIKDKNADYSSGRSGINDYMMYIFAILPSVFGAISCFEIILNLRLKDKTAVTPVFQQSASQVSQKFGWFDKAHRQSTFIDPQKLSQLTNFFGSTLAEKNFQSSPRKDELVISNFPEPNPGANNETTDTQAFTVDQGSTTRRGTKLFSINGNIPDQASPGINPVVKRLAARKSFILPGTSISSPQKNLTIVDPMQTMVTMPDDGITGRSNKSEIPLLNNTPSREEIVPFNASYEGVITKNPYAFDRSKTMNLNEMRNRNKEERFKTMIDRSHWVQSMTSGMSLHLREQSKDMIDEDGFKKFIGGLGNGEPPKSDVVVQNLY